MECGQDLPQNLNKKLRTNVGYKDHDYGCLNNTSLALNVEPTSHVVLQFLWVCSQRHPMYIPLLISFQSLHESWTAGQTIAHPNSGVPHIRVHASTPCSPFTWNLIQTSLSLQPFRRSSPREGQFQDDRHAPKIC
jgi:hypothetical protein